MLHLIVRLIPAPLHRLGYRIAFALRKRWWRLVPSKVTGCRIVAVDGEGRVLLVRHSYGARDWMLPGGGMNPGEEAAAAASRELHEETGCTIAHIREIERIERPLYGSTNVVHVLMGIAGGIPRADGREIVAAAFFALDSLPADMPPWLRARLPGWVIAARAGHRPSAAPPPALPPSPTG